MVSPRCGVSARRSLAHRVPDEHEVRLEGHDFLHQNLNVPPLLLQERVEAREPERQGVARANAPALKLHAAAHEQHGGAPHCADHLFVHHVLAEHDPVHVGAVGQAA